MILAYLPLSQMYFVLASKALFSFGIEATLPRCHCHDQHLRLEQRREVLAKDKEAASFIGILFAPVPQADVQVNARKKA